VPDEKMSVEPVMGAQIALLDEDLAIAGRPERRLER